jgi:hypothetical protein
MQQTRRKTKMPIAIMKPPAMGNWVWSLYCLAERAWRGGCEDVTGSVGAILATVFLEIATEGNELNLCSLR